MLTQTPKTPEEICQAVALDLKSRGLTHQAVADMLGFTKQTISAQISGKRKFSKEMAFAFAKGLGYNATFLLFGEGELKEPNLGFELTSTSLDTSDLNNTVIALAGMTEIATSLINACGNSMAREAWEYLQSGNYEAYRNRMLQLREQLGVKVYYGPVLARMICDSIERAKKKGLGHTYLPVIDGE